MSRRSPTRWFQKQHLTSQQQHVHPRHPRTDVQYISSFPSPGSSGTTPKLPHNTSPDPLALLSSELDSLRSSVVTLLCSGNPALSKVAEYYFLHPSKQIRPLLVLLFSQATNGLGSRWSQKLWESEQDGEEELLDRPLTRPDVLNDWNPKSDKWTREFRKEFQIDTTLLQGDVRRRTTIPTTPAHLRDDPTNASISPPRLHIPPLILPAQYRLAQILEMAHVASLLHDDVIDGSPLRRGMPSAPSAFGQRFTILGGVFILGRTWGALARLRDRDATELISTVVANLVDGEILQLKKVKDSVVGEGRGAREEAWNGYLQKTYLKTASLMAKGARAAVTLGGCREGDIVREIAYAYGRNMGIAFQLVDDALDSESASATLGKPSGVDLQLGLATGPALYAWQEYPEMEGLIRRKFSEEGDVERARELIGRSQGVQRTRVLAQLYASKAKEVIQPLPDSEAKKALEALAERVVDRKS